MKIGSLDLQGAVVLAPLAGVTDPAFRQIVQRFGVGAVWTEMISADGLVRCRRRFRTMDLSGHRVPTVFQISGKDPVAMAEAARIVQDSGAAAVDVNMGCPANKIVRKGAGAALMRDSDLAGRIVRSVRDAADIPVTVKIRSGWDEQTRNAEEMARIVEEEGADAIIVHSRVRTQRHSGPASLDVIRRVKESVRIPVIGNGGLCTVQDAIRMKTATNCDGLMIGRGALGRPWIPGRIMRHFGGPPRASDEPQTMVEVIKDHFQYQLSGFDTRSSVYRMRKHLGWYSKGFAGGPEFRRRICREEDLGRVLESVEQFFGKAAIA